MQKEIKRFSVPGKRKGHRLFSEASAFIQTRTSKQCKSHYQKMISKSKTPEAVISAYKIKIGEENFRQKSEEYVKNLREVFTINT